MAKSFLTIFLIILSSTFVLAQKTYLFIGTYTDDVPEKGIYIYELDGGTGALSPISTGENITNPSYLTISPDGNYLYACTDTKMPDNGNISAFRFNSDDGSLHFINKQPTNGDNPVYVSIDNISQYVVTATYTGGTASIYKINPDGSIQPYTQHFLFEGKGAIEERQEKPHIHSAVFSPDYRYIYFPDLGADKIRTFKFDSENNKPLQAVQKFDYNAIPGSGPRHLTFHPKGTFAYCTDELSGTVTAFKFKRGKLKPIQRIFSYSNEQEYYATADIHISPDGLFLYASNRKLEENTISIFSINQHNGKLTLIGHQSTLGDHPRNFTIDPSGNFLLVANMKTNNIVVFRRNQKTGLLTNTGIQITVPNPSCLKMRIY